MITHAVVTWCQLHKHVHVTEQCQIFHSSPEIPLLLMFFAVVFLSSVSAYVHLYARQVYTYGIFVTLEFLQVQSL